MCAPAAVALIPAIISLVGAGASVAGSVINANAQRGAADAQAGAADRNRDLANQAAQDATQRGYAEEAKYRGQASAFESKQRVAAAATGVDTQSGSVLDTLSNTAGMAELDALTIRNNAAREAYGYKTQGVEFGRQAGYARRAGDAAVAGSLLTGAGQTLGQLGSAYGYASDYFKQPPKKG